MKLTTFLKTHHACDPALRWARNRETNCAAWRACKNGEWLGFLIAAIGMARDYRLWEIQDAVLEDMGLTFDRLVNGQIGRQAHSEYLERYARAIRKIVPWSEIKKYIPKD